MHKPIAVPIHFRATNRADFFLNIATKLEKVFSLRVKPVRLLNSLSFSCQTSVLTLSLRCQIKDQKLLFVFVNFQNLVDSVQITTNPLQTKLDHGQGEDSPQNPTIFDDNSLASNDSTDAFFKEVLPSNNSSFS